MKFAFGPETHPLPGYTIKRAIDRGGFGEVYYALSDSGKEVALKLLRDNPDIELRGVSHCLNLKHPNLVTLYDVRIDSDGDSWVIMEYISGESLEVVLGKHPQGLPAEDVMQWLAGAADGIAYLHERDIVHRDLKPANIFRDQGIVKIGDVGLSKFMTPSRRSAQTESVGTVHYMAPEVARGKYGRELDVYSLAVIVFEMLTGKVPFDGESTAEILMKHLTARPDLSAVDASFRPVLERALEKDPHRRTPTIRQFTDEFQQAFRATRTDFDPATGMNGASYGRTNGAGWTNGDAAHASAHATAEHARRKMAGYADTVRRAASTGHDRAAYGDPGQNRQTRDGKRGPGTSAWWWLAVPFGILFLIRASSGRGVFPIPMQPRAWLSFALLGGAAYVAYLVVSKVVNSLLAPLPTVPYPANRWRDEYDGEYEGTAVASPPVVRPVPEARDPRSAIRPVPVARAPRRIWLGPELVRPMTLSSRWQDIFTSMTWATFWTVVCTALTSVVLQGLGQSSPSMSLSQNPAQLALFGFTTLAAAWIMLPVTKLMEGSRTPSQRRRVVLAVAGAGVGLVAWWLTEMIPGSMNQETGNFRGIVQRVGTWDLAAPDIVAKMSTARASTLAGYMTFFAVLFSLRRWHMQTDSFRTKRFRWLSWMFTGFVAWAVTAAFTFPHLWATCWGLALSAVVQLSSGWISPDERSDWISTEQARLAKKHGGAAAEIPPTSVVS